MASHTTDQHEQKQQGAADLGQIMGTAKKGKGKSRSDQAKQVVSAIMRTRAMLPDPGQVAAELVEVPLDAIDVKAQVRTAVSAESEGIRELAADIAARGVLQPVLLRQVAGRFELVAGERRFVASGLAGRSTIPAIVRSMTDDEAKLAQLAENIQREDLTTMERASAVRALFEVSRSLQSVADAIKKSKSWVSKLLVLTYPDYHPAARELMERGECDDVETLYLLGKVCELDAKLGDTLCRQIRSGQASRSTVRWCLDDIRTRAAMSQPRQPEVTTQGQPQMPLIPEQPKQPEPKQPEPKRPADLRKPDLPFVPPEAFAEYAVRWVHEARITWTIADMEKHLWGAAQMAACLAEGVYTHLYDTLDLEPYERASLYAHVIEQALNEAR